METPTWVIYLETDKPGALHTDRFHNRYANMTLQLTKPDAGGGRAVLAPPILGVAQHSRPARAAVPQARVTGCCSALGATCGVGSPDVAATAGAV